MNGALIALLRAGVIATCGLVLGAGMVGGAQSLLIDTVNAMSNAYAAIRMPPTLAGGGGL